MIKFCDEIMEMAFKKMPHRNIVNMLCSMGVDSVAAAHYCNSNLHKVSGSLYMRHFNHGVRDQNNQMQKSYIRYMRDPDIGFKGYAPADLKPFIKNFSEDGLRQARLEFIKKNADYTIYITAHHLDDATESYMMNVLRGKENFLPIPFMTEVGTNLIVHPFLFTRKQDFREYAEKNNLMKYVVEDETNRVTKGSRRNFIRNEIMPLLNREQMGVPTIVRKKMEKRLHGF
jgi:tRNA(Ile)-lysidine synthase